jgi:hypothetical protein
MSIMAQELTAQGSVGSAIALWHHGGLVGIGTATQLHVVTLRDMATILHG